MRPQSTLRPARAAAVAALAAVGTAAAPQAAARAAAPATTAVPAPVVRIAIADATLRHGDRVTVAGRTTARQRGRVVALEFRSSGRRWRPLATATVRADGRFRFTIQASRSGTLRAVLRAPAAAQAAPGGRTAIRSRGRGISVSAAVLGAGRDVDVRRDQRATLRGVLAPRARGRVVTLERRVGGDWRRVARATTDRRGAFRFRFTPTTAGSWPLRVRFRGDRANAGTVRRVGRLNSYRRSFASWYWLYGSAVACGGTLGYNEMGVAHKWLPCGTMLTIRYRGRTARAKVIDRGPYVAGREFDLTEAVKNKLGMGGVGTILVDR